MGLGGGRKKSILKDLRQLEFYENSVDPLDRGWVGSY